MEQPTPGLDWRHVATVVITGAGGLLARDARNWYRRRKAERDRQHELFLAAVDAVQLLLDESRAHEDMRRTQKIRPRTSEELAYDAAQRAQRRQDVARRLYEASTGKKDRRHAQDVLAPEQLEADER